MLEKHLLIWLLAVRATTPQPTQQIRIRHMFCQKANVEEKMPVGRILHPPGLPQQPLHQVSSWRVSTPSQLRRARLLRTRYFLA
jgi:hypothetical protein